MSTHEEQCTIGFPRERMLAACRVAIQRLGWRILQENDLGLVCTEPPPQNPFTTQVKDEIGVFSSPSDKKTRIMLRGSNQGLGPIQSNHVKSQLKKLMDELGRAAVQAPASTPSPV